MVYIQGKKSQGDLAFFGVSESDSGERVTSDSVFALPAFLNGTRLISSSVARADCYLYKVLPDGGRQIDDNHIVFELITRKVNPWQTYFVWIQGLVSNALWSGNGYSLIERDELGTPIALHLLDSRCVYPFQEFTAGKLTGAYYAFEQDGKQHIIPADDMIHVRNLSVHTGLCGISIVDQLRTALGKALAIQKFATIYFKHGSHIEKALKIPGWLTADQQQALRESMQSLHEGLSTSHKMAVLMGGAELISLPINASDSQLVESTEVSLQDIANILGVPSSKLGARGAISYGSLEQDNLWFLSDTLDAWMTLIEAELNAKLLSYREGWKRFVEFDRESLFASEPTYAASLMAQFQGKALAWEEMRAKLKRSLDTEGLTFGSVPGQEPVAAPAPPAPEAPADPGKPQQGQQEAPQQPQQEQASKARAKGQRLTYATLERLRTRLAKAVGSSTDLGKHEEVIRASLPDGAELALADLVKLQDEVAAVLPEQRSAVIERWDIAALTEKLWQE